MVAGIPQERFKQLNSQDIRESGKYVLYWMQAAHRTKDNPALAYAASRANTLGLPLVVGFVLMTDFPEASLRHFTFMLEGLAETFESLRQLGALPVLRTGRGAPEMAELSRHAAEMVLDQGYLRLHKESYQHLAETVECRLIQVEGEAVVPVELASEKAEHAARTIRPRIRRHLNDFLQPARTAKVQTSAADLRLESLSERLRDPAEFLAELKVDSAVKPVSRHFLGGPSAAESHLAHFLEQRLARYDVMRNQPQTDFTSMMSPYLHYGMISPVSVALSVQKHAHPSDANAASYVEELVIRRGLSQNFCHFTDDYDKFACLPPWARKTMAEHASDKRPEVYTRAELEAGETHDPYWNAAQVEMVETGYMHNHMRMYWGKKILEWSSSHENAYQNTLYLNNKFFLDGRDPVSFANVAWIFGLHDRAWTERAIYGKLRCMMASGLERKSKPKDYVAKVERITGRKVRGAELGLF